MQHLSRTCHYSPSNRIKRPNRVDQLELVAPQGSISTASADWASPDNCPCDRQDTWIHSLLQHIHSPSQFSAKRIYLQFIQQPKLVSVFKQAKYNSAERKQCRRKRRDASKMMWCETNDSTNTSVCRVMVMFKANEVKVSESIQCCGIDIIIIIILSYL